MKTIKVNHVVLTLRISPAGMGESQAEVDDKVNRRLAEGYSTVDVYPLKTNFDERQQPTDIIQLYIFKAYEGEPAAKKAKASA